MIRMEERVAFDDVVTGMLASGCFSPVKSEGCHVIPDNPEARYRLLVERGWLFLRFLPTCDWVRAVIGNSTDLEQLHLICEESWFQEPRAAERHVGRWVGLNSLPPPKRRRVESLLEAGLRPDSIHRRITLFGHSLSGPFTILDGNHRILALAHDCRFRGRSFEPFEVHVGLSFGPCRWHGDPMTWEERPELDGQRRFVLRVW